MAEIKLPTAEKQNDILSKVNGVHDALNDIASNFPLDISGGTDFSKITSFAIYSTSTSTSEQLIADIDGPGVVVFQTYSGGNGNFPRTVRIVIDDSEIIIPSGDFTNPAWVPFSTKLQVFGKVKSSTYPGVISINGFLFD